MTFTGFIGKVVHLPLRLIIAVCVRLRIHPNVLTFTGVLIAVWAGIHLARGDFMMAGFHAFALIFIIRGYMACRELKAEKNEQQTNWTSDLERIDA